MASTKFRRDTQVNFSSVISILYTPGSVNLIKLLLAFELKTVNVDGVIFRTGLGLRILVCDKLSTELAHILLVDKAATILKLSPKLK